MRRAQEFLYDVGIRVYYALIWGASFINPKAKLWIDGRKNWKKQLSNFNLKPHQTVWVHCASLGEFEQGRPIIEYIKKHYPAYRILLTFYSPSGYEIRKNYDLADAVMYLPLDTAANARHLVHSLRPALAVFIKYEFWYHFLHILHNSDVPTFLVSAHFRPNQVFFKWYGALHRRMLDFFSILFVQDDASKKLLASISVQSVIVAGDTRLDRVLTIKNTIHQISALTPFLAKNKSIVVAGSTWPKDESLLMQWLHLNTANAQLILVPHEVDDEHIAQIIAKCKVKYARFSQLMGTEQTPDVIIVDGIGLLSKIYQYGDVAYIGGGFGAGIHNILEPIVFGVPVVFGPKHEKFLEAQELLAVNAAFCIRSGKELANTFRDLLKNREFHQKSVNQIEHYIQKKKGAINMVARHLSKTLKQ